MTHYPDHTAIAKKLLDQQGEINDLRAALTNRGASADPLDEHTTPDLATVAAAYRQAADLLETSGELRDYTDGRMGDINEAAAFLRRRADELHAPPAK